MKCLSFAVAGAAALLVLTSAGRLFAGVVMAETSFTKGPNGQISSQNKTLYVQGNKQRIELGGVIEITDLDKNVVDIIDKHNRAYAEMPLRGLSSSQLDSMHDEAILKKTGEIRVIANHPCNEYRNVEGNELVHVTTIACVSTSAPGTKELSRFAHNVVTRFTGRKFERPAENGPRGLMLEKQSILSYSVPDSSRGTTSRTTSYLVETRVNKITLQPLPPETFNPPDGYSKLQNLPPRTAPPDLPILMSSI